MAISFNNSFIIIGVFIPVCGAGGRASAPVWVSSLGGAHRKAMRKVFHMTFETVMLTLNERLLLVLI